MIFSEIQTLLDNNKLTEALKLISSELKKNYDFSDPVQKTTFDQLQNKLVKTQQLLTQELFASHFDSKDNSFLSKLKSIANPSISFNLIQSLILAMKKKDGVNNDKNTNERLTQDIFQSSLKRIKFETCSINYIEPAGENIIVVLNKITDKNTLSTLGLAGDWDNKVKVGQHIITKGSQGLDLHILNSILSVSWDDSVDILKGFNEILNSLCAKNIEDINIFFISNDSSFTEDIYRLLFLQFIGYIIFALASFPYLDIKINVIEKQIKRSLERITLGIGQSYITDDKNGYSKGDIDRFVKKALTQNPFYISQLESLYRIINEDIPILICGNTGVGKSILAKIIHQESIRASSKIEEINCGGLEADRVEMNLYGWVKGAFTGSLFDKKGKIALAEGGTLFLDEIHRSHVSVRNSLITFIENKQYTVLGKNSAEEADVRMIFGTNADLKKLIAKKEFEEDFYYRISARKIIIPPLRERINDIDIIIDYVLEKLCVKKGKVVSIEKSAIELLKEYSWPGNVRELSRYLEQRFIDCVYEDSNIITAKIIQAAPFENLSAADSDDLNVLIELLKKFLDNWDITKGDIQHELIAPIIAKLYIEDSFNHWNKTKKYESAMKVVGMGGKGFNDSTLQKFYDQYPNIRKILGLED